MKKEEIIPKWMFNHLQKQSQRARDQAISQLKRKVKDIKQEVRNEVAWDFVMNKTVSECFNYNDERWNYPSFSLRTRTKKQIKEMQDAATEETVEPLVKKINDIKRRYNQWENDILSGKIKRQNAKKFEP